MGFKHTGKSQHGRALASSLRYRFVDTDLLIQELDSTESGMRRTVRDIYREDGRQRFQQLEATACRLAVEYEDPSIIATGGGLCENPAALEPVGEHLLVHLVDSLEEISMRVLRAGIPAFLETADPREARERLAVLFKRRVSTYDDLAAVRIDLSGMSLERARESVLSTVEAYLGR